MRKVGNQIIITGLGRSKGNYGDELVNFLKLKVRVRYPSIEYK